MAKIQCEIEYVELENDNGQLIEGVTVTCGRCEHTTESFGTSGASVRRCLVLLRQECPEGEHNYYVADYDDD